MKNETSRFYAGTSGLVLPVPNKSHYPVDFQDKSRLGYYGSLFNSIEINSSFYKIPQPKTVARWQEEVPADFRFTFKLFKNITHNKNLTYSVEDIDRFLNAIGEARNKKGALLIQLPGSIRFEQYGRLEQLLNDLSAHANIKGWQLAIELRDPSWYVAETWELLNEFRTSIVYHDMPKSVPPKILQKSRAIYLRFHGPTGNYRGGYDAASLQSQADLVTGWLKAGKTVFVYFNNTLGAAIPNLQTLRQYLA